MDTTTGEAGSEESPADSLEELIRELPLALYRAQPGREGRWTYVSPQIEDLLGYPREEWLADPISWIRHVHPDDRDQVLEIEREALASGDDFLAEYRFQRSTGEWIWVRDRARVVESPEGPVLVGGIVDITIERTERDELKRTRELFGALVRHSVDVVKVLDRSARIRLVGPQITEMSGFALDEVVGRRCVELMHPDDREQVAAAIDRCALGDAPEITVEGRHARKDGSWIWVEMRARNRLDDPAVQGIVVAERDITARKTSEQQRVDLEARLQRSQRLEAIGQLTGGIAHDFNNLLSVIQNYAVFVVDGLEDDDPRREDAQEVIAAAQRAADLTHQLLLFSRQETARIEVVDIGAATNSLYRMLRRTMPEDIHLTLELPDRGPSVEIDKGQLEQVVMNLLANAQDALPQGGRIAIRVATDEVSDENDETLQPGTYAKLTVEDDGEGMPPHVVQRIFDPFFTTKPRGQGTGLGLATVYGIVTRFGGDIRARSEEGVGTRFVVYLPRSDSSASVAKPVVDEQSDHPVRDAHILLVEDEPALLRISTRILERSGYRVSAYEDPIEAHAAAKDSDERFDLLLTDVIMPGMSGRELSERLGLPTIFASGYTDNILEQRGALDGGVVVLTKPFQRADLLAAVRTALLSA